LKVIPKRLYGLSVSITTKWLNLSITASETGGKNAPSSPHTNSEGVELTYISSIPSGSEFHYCFFFHGFTCRYRKLSDP
ncbi:hypothetical protein, partial [uncultured Algoriphagus sp.]|uniref:hypothetical protein n=1 Tax=uncultured Algoriphagus sp. TaxID=417365 RepID=UPI0032B16C12